MPYIIDGHNLIPKLGIPLSRMDDEPLLVEKLINFCRVQRTQVEVYFDGAPPGQSGLRKHGSVTAFYIRQGSTADAAIEARLAKLGRGSRNWVVVSSDRRVVSSARAAHAGTLSSEEFARQLALSGESSTNDPGMGKPLPESEVDEWMRLFRSEPPRK